MNDDRSPDTDGQRLLVAGVLAGLPTLLAVLASYEDPSSVLRSPSVFVLFLGTVVVGSLLVTGLPAALLVGYRLVAPVVVVAGVVLFWTVATPRGDAPDVVFVVLTSPVYLGVALVAGSVEHRLRFGSFLPT